MRLTGSTAEEMVAEEAAHISSAIASADLRESPSAHIFVESLFSDAFYARLEALFPTDPAAFVRWNHGGDPSIFFGNYDRRLEINFPQDVERLSLEQRGLWTALSDYLCGERFARVLLEKFHGALEDRFGAAMDEPDFFHTRMRGAMMLNKHDSGYYLGPHTDRFEKIVTCVFYMPERAGLDHLGTTLYAPNDAQFRCRGTVHHDPANFHVRETIPFRANSAFIFARSDVLFHGVQQLAPELLRGSERPGFQMQFWER